MVGDLQLPVVVGPADGEVALRPHGDDEEDAEAERDPDLRREEFQLFHFPFSRVLKRKMFLSSYLL